MRGTNFLGSAPSMRSVLRQEARSSTFKDILLESRSNETQFQPRDEQQTYYYRSAMKPHKKLERDSLVTIHELAHALPDFVWSITSFPNLVMCFGMPDLLYIVKQCPTFLMSYDTTFNLGDFYLSVLVVKVSNVLEEPYVPIAFVMHERKFQSVHAALCDELRRRLPIRQKTYTQNYRSTMRKHLHNVRRTLGQTDESTHSD